MVASESVALDVLGFELLGDVLPGEAICVTQTGEPIGSNVPMSLSSRRAYLNTFISPVLIR